MCSNSPLTEVPRKLTNPLLGIKDWLGRQSKSRRFWKPKAAPIGQEANQLDLSSFGGEAWPRSTWGCLQLYWARMAACVLEDGPLFQPNGRVVLYVADAQRDLSTAHPVMGWKVCSPPPLAPTTKRYTEGLTPWYLWVWPYLEIEGLQM